MADIFALLKNIPILKEYDDHTIKDLIPGTEFVQIPNEKVIFQTGELAQYCFVICYGSVRISKNSRNGRDVVMSFLRPGDFVAAGIMSHAVSAYPVTAHAHEDSGLLKITRKSYLDHWQGHPEIARTISQHLMQRMMDFQIDKAMSVSSVPQKIASFLLRTLDHQPPQFGKTISIPLTRRDISERVGTTVETVIRALSEWTQKGWLNTTDQRIEILDRHALEMLINNEKS